MPAHALLVRVSTPSPPRGETSRPCRHGRTRAPRAEIACERVEWKFSATLELNQALSLHQQKLLRLTGTLRNPSSLSFSHSSGGWALLR